MCIRRPLGLLPKFVTSTSEAAEAGVVNCRRAAMSRTAALRLLSTSPLIFMRSPLIYTPKRSDYHPETFRNTTLPRHVPAAHAAHLARRGSESFRHGSVRIAPGPPPI